MRKLLFLCVLGLIIASPVVAGPQRIDERSLVERVQNWNYTSIAPSALKNQIDDKDARLVDIDVVNTSPLRFSASLVKNTGAHKAGWWWLYNSTPQAINDLADEKDARVIDIETYMNGGQRKFAALLVSNKGKRKTSWYWYFNQTPDSLKQKYDDFNQRLIDIEPYKDGNITKYAAVMVDNTGDQETGWYWYRNQTAAQLRNKLSRNNMRLTDIESYNSSSGVRYAAIMKNFDQSQEQYYWYYYGISGSDLKIMARRHGARVLDIDESKTGNGYDAILLNNGIAKSGHCGGKLKHFGDRVTDVMKRYAIPGAQVSVVKDGRLVYSCAIGQADLSKNEKVRPDHLFRIMSVSKLITKSAIRHLEKEGDLSRGDTMIDALKNRAPDGPYADANMSNITVQHLMDHKGGFVNNNPYDPMTNQPAVAADIGGPTPVSCKKIMDYAIPNFPLGFTPGNQGRVQDNRAYSNLGYCILQQIVRANSGKTYSKYVKDEILTPAGVSRMTIGHGRKAKRKEDEVVYYSVPFDEKRSSPYPQDTTDVPRPYSIVVEAMAGHGGWIASANDLVRYAAFASTRPDGTGRISFMGSIVGTRSILRERNNAYVAINLNSSPSGAEDFTTEFFDLVDNAVDDTNQWPTRNLWSEYDYPQ